MIHGDRIIHQLYSGTVQDSFVLCQYPVCKGITEMFCRANPVATLLLVDMTPHLCIILVNRVPEWAVYKLVDVRGGTK